MADHARSAARVASGGARGGRTLALLLTALAVCALLLGTNDDEDDKPKDAPGQFVVSAAPPAAPAPASTPSTTVLDPSVALPLPAGGNRPVDPLQIVLAVASDPITRTEDPRARRRTDIAVLGRWLAAHHNPATTLTLATPGRRWRFAAAVPPGRAMLTASSTFPLARPARSSRLRTVTLLIGRAPEGGAPGGTLVRLRPTRGAASQPRPSDVHAVTYVDPTKRNAIAATAARTIMAISGQRER